MTTRYLRTYPIEWPVFSTRFYTQDSDGWWNPKPRINKKKEKEILFKSDT